MFESEIYKKGNVFKFVNMPYFQLNAPSFLSKKDIKQIINIGIQEKTGLKESEYNLFWDIITKNTLFFHTLRDIFLNLVGRK